MGEAFGEPAQSRHAHRLRTVQGHPQAGEVQSFQALVIDLVEAQLVGEVWGNGERGAKAMDCPQPAFRPHQKA